MSRELKWYSFRWQTGAALLIVCAFMWYFMQGRFLHPIGRGPAGPAVSSAPFELVWSKDKVVLLGVGDSITSGYGASFGNDYFSLLVKNDDAKHPDMRGRDLQHVYPRLSSINYAAPGTTSEEHMNDQVHYLRPYPSNVKGIVVMTTGGNDVIHDYGRSTPKDGAMYGCTLNDALKWKESYRSRLSAMLDKIDSAFPGGCDIFLANIYDPTDGIGDIHNALLTLPRWRDGTRVLEVMNQTIAETAEKHSNVHLVDIHALFLGHGIHCRDRRNDHYRKDDPNYWYFSNLEDPNDRGYDAIRRAFLLKMIETMGPSAEKPLK